MPDQAGLAIEIEGKLRAGDRQAALRLLAGPQALEASSVELARLAESAGDPELALNLLRKVISADRKNFAAWTLAASILEETGLSEEALSCRKRALALTPTDLETLGALVELARESGDLETASQAIEAARDAGTPDEALKPLEARLGRVRAENPADLPLQDGQAANPSPPADDQVFRFLRAFSGREGIFARQWFDPGQGKGGYTPVRESFSFKHAREHLLGAVTLGVYPLRLDRTVRFCAFDVDMTRRAMDLVKGDPDRAKALRQAVDRTADRIARQLGRLGIDCIVEDSGFKGRHVWILFQEPIDAALVRRFGAALLRAAGPPAPGTAIEFFPKQSRTSGGPGNLIKLPLGVHRRTGRWTAFLDGDGGELDDPHAALLALERVGRSGLEKALAALPPAGPDDSTSAGREKRDGDPEEKPARENAAAGSFPVPEPGPAWTEADFRADPEVSFLIDRCPVLRALVDRVLETRSLSHDEAVVVRHVLGHHPRGLIAANWLFERSGTAEALFLKTKLSGNPVSCSKIRKRIPAVAGRAGCACAFEERAGDYPHPLRHLDGLPDPGAVAAEAETPDLQDMARRLGAMLARLAELRADADDVRAALLESMLGSGLETVVFEEGSFRAVQGRGEPVTLVWEPREKGSVRLIRPAPAGKAAGPADRKPVARSGS